MMRIKM